MRKYLRIDLFAAVGSDCHLIEVVGYAPRKFQQFVHLVIVKYYDVAFEDHVAEEIAPGLHTACRELAVKRFVFFVTEPTRTPYEQSKSAINRRFCYKYNKAS